MSTTTVTTTVTTTDGTTTTTTTTTTAARPAAAVASPPAVAPVEDADVEEGTPPVSRRSDYDGPKTLDEAVTVGFLSKALGAEVAAVVKRKDLVGGVLSFASMVTVKYADPKADGPTTIVVKIPSDVQGSRDFAVMLNAYIKEVNVYKLLQGKLAELDFRIPKLYYADHDGMDDDWCEYFVLVMEAFDPAEWVVQDQLVGTNLADWKLAAVSLAKLHAGFYKADVLQAKWVGKDPATPSICENLGVAFPNFPATWESLKSTWGEGTSNPNTKKMFYWHEGATLFTSPKNEAAGGTPFSAQAQADMRGLFDFLAQEKVAVPLMQAMTGIIASRKARTLVYGDFRGDNFFVSKSGDKMAFIDFQVFNSGSPGFDFNQPTVSSLH